MLNLQHLIEQACKESNRDMILISHGSVHCVSIFGSILDNNRVIAAAATILATCVSTQAITLTEAKEAIQVLITKHKIRRIDDQCVMYWPTLLVYNQ